MTESLAPLASIVPIPAPLPSEAWALSNPPAGTPASVSFVVLPEEQVQAWQATARWAGINTEHSETALTYAQQNALSFRGQATQAVKVATAVEKLAADMLKPVPRASTTNAELAEALLMSLVPVMPNASPEVIMDRVRALIVRFRLFYPSASTPAPR